MIKNTIVIVFMICVFSKLAITLQIHLKPLQISNQPKHTQGISRSHNRQITRYLGNQKLGIQHIFQKSQYDLVGIKGRSNTIINSLGFIFRSRSPANANDSTTNTSIIATIVSTEMYGGITGKQFQWIAEKGQKINKIKIWAGDYIQGIEVQTNKNKVSPHWGNRYGKMKILNIGNSHACGVVVRSQLFVNAIALILE